MRDYAGCARYTIPDVGREGTGTSPNLELFQEVCARTRTPVLAAGGIRTLTDLRALAALAPVGVEGAVVGRALFTGDLHLADALTTVT
ncbi:HisA/HisF-related TIM barrel protein [Kitasatospora sp. LaBMicrA B282]|uniref:HisA/HisF-related TIM barrel protein n=1 Tax=Kitasatospora sp. LaBMicrA B282 TaxID=3420949 RepID=UPI003D0E5B25